jgi:hypothetical protein
LALFLKKRKSYKHYVTPKAKFDPISHIWFMGEFNVKLLHASEAPTEEHDLQSKPSSTLAELADAVLKKPADEVWRYAVLPEHVVIRTGKITMKAKIHGPHRGVSFVRVPHLGKIVVEKGLLRAPLGHEELIIDEFLDPKKKTQMAMEDLLLD